MNSQKNCASTVTQNMITIQGSALDAIVEEVLRRQSRRQHIKCTGINSNTQNIQNINGRRSLATKRNSFNSWINRHPRGRCWAKCQVQVITHPILWPSTLSIGREQMILSSFTRLVSRTAHSGRQALKSRSEAIRRINQKLQFPASVTSNSPIWDRFDCNAHLCTREDSLPSPF